MQDQRYGPLDRRPVICLLVDVANIPEDAIAPLVQELRRRGTLAAMFAFGDWHRRDMHLRHRLLDALGFLCIHGGSWENGSGGLKSMVDSIMKRTIKWMPQWFPACDTYVLATGDRDFSHDASDLRWRGFQVWIAAGEASINNELRLGADEFISLDRLPGRTMPAALLGVPPGYYEQTFGARRPFRAGPPAPAEVAPPPRAAVVPAPVRPTPASAPPRLPAPPPPSVSPAVTPATVAPVPSAARAPVTEAEDRALLVQVRDLAGPRGYVAQREALRALAPADDPGGRVRSRLSNQLRDLVERNLLVRTNAMIGGNLTQVLVLPGVAVTDAAAETTVDTEVGAERRGRRRVRRGGHTGVEGEPAAAESGEPAAVVVEAPAPVAATPAPEPPAVVVEAPAPVAATPAPAAPPVAVEPRAPVTAPLPAVAPAAERAPTVLPPERRAASSAGADGERRSEAPRPAARRVEAPISRSAESSAPAAEPAPARPSWRDAVAAALQQVRGEGDGRPPTRSSAPPTVAPAPAAAAVPVAPPVAAAPPDVASEAGGEADAADGEAGEAAPARRRRRRRPASAPADAPGAAPESEAGVVETAPVAAIAEALPTPMPEDEPEEHAPESTDAGDEPARRRPARRRRRPAAPTDVPPTPAAV
ncbi:MAG: NYN domain-containing protein [Chloroflexi bacterium]|nr:NYN domain-containing protein [Chloroflexota bacterium]